MFIFGVKIGNWITFKREVRLISKRCFLRVSKDKETPSASSMHVDWTYIRIYLYICGHVSTSVQLLIYTRKGEQLLRSEKHGVKWKERPWLASNPVHEGCHKLHRRDLLEKRDWQVQKVGRKGHFKEQANSYYLPMHMLCVMLLPEGHWGPKPARLLQAAGLIAGPQRPSSAPLCPPQHPGNAFDPFKQPRALEGFKHLKPINAVH